MIKNYIDTLFRRWGEEHFGKEKMDKVSETDLILARMYTMTFASHLASFGEELPKDFIKETFFDYIQDIIKRVA